MIAVDEHTIRQDVRQWSGLFPTGAWAALASVALIVIQVVIFLVWSTPRSTRGLFEMLVENPAARPARARPALCGEQPAG
jgi:hypothetical protein